jgi:hypothetical protein
MLGLPPPAVIFFGSTFILSFPCCQQKARLLYTDEETGANSKPCSLLSHTHPRSPHLMAHAGSKPSRGGTDSSQFLVYGLGRVASVK